MEVAIPIFLTKLAFWGKISIILYLLLLYILQRMHVQSKYESV